MNLAELQKQIKGCTRCILRESATQPVCGYGDIGAKYLIVGEAPGSEEDKLGMPFIGAAGKKLDKLLALAKINPNEIFLTNTCRCQPPRDKEGKQMHPAKKQVKLCHQWLVQEIDLIKPEFIITLGAIPLTLFTDVGIGKMHGTMLVLPKYKVIAQYHPAAALHQPRLWASMLADWENFPVVVPSDYTVRPESVPPPAEYALDTETSGIGQFQIGDWSIAYRDKDGLAVERFRGARKGKQWGKTRCIMHNAKFDLRILRANGMTEPEDVHDTMICAYVLGMGFQAPTDDTKNSSGANMIGGLGLKYLARKHLGMQMQEWKDVENHPELIPAYNDRDSISTYLLWEKWKPLLPKHYWDIDMPLLKTLMAMEDRGIAIDQAYLGEYAKELEGKLQAIDLPLNPNATQEVASYVYGTLEVEPWQFTKTGNPSVDEDTLKVIDDSVVKKILEYKEISKELETYADNYIQGSMHDGRLHPEFKQVRTATGRLSCANPNLQNVPTEGGMRKLFVAKEGHKLVVSDYSQIELRMIAYLSQDPVMLEAFRTNADIHDTTLKRMQVFMPKMIRRDAKVINFLTIYGGDAWKISLEFGIPIEEARAFQQAYFGTYPGVKLYMDKCRADAREKREAVLWTGRRRRLDAMYASDWRVQKEGEREGINTPVQGGAGEVVKIAMNDLHYKYHAPMILQVHDEIIFEVPEKDALEYAHWIKGYLPNLTVLGDVNFPVDVGVGKNWQEAKENKIE